MNPVERFRRTPGVTSIDAGGLSGFIEASSPGLLVVLGDPARRPEASDVAVVMRDVAQSSPGLRIGVVDEAGAAAAKKCLGAVKEPIVAALAGGVVTRLLEGMQDWGVYAAVVRDLEAGRDDGGGA